MAPTPGRSIPIVPAIPAGTTRAPTSGTSIVAAKCSGPRLATLHNLHYYLALMARMREAIAAGRFAPFRASFHAALRDG